MSIRKKSKGEPFCIYRPVEFDTERDMEIISIDPGIINFAVRIEVRHTDGRITTKVFQNIKLSQTKDTDMGNLCQSLTEELDKIDFSNSNILVVEKQLDVNYKPLRLSQHTISYFLLRYSHIGILEIHPQIKGRMLGAGKLKKPELKKWAIEKAKELLEERGDNFALEILNKKRIKKDDLADTVCQIEGFYRHICSIKFSTEEIK